MHCLWTRNWSNTPALRETSKTVTYGLYTYVCEWNLQIWLSHANIYIFQSLGLDVLQVRHSRDRATGSVFAPASASD